MHKKHLAQQFESQSSTENNNPYLNQKFQKKNTG